MRTNQLAQISEVAQIKVVRCLYYSTISLKIINNYFKSVISSTILSNLPIHDSNILSGKEQEISKTLLNPPELCISSPKHNPQMHLDTTLFAWRPSPDSPCPANLPEFISKITIHKKQKNHT